jgi:hypothetical protein
VESPAAKRITRPWRDPRPTLAAASLLVLASVLSLLLLELPGPLVLAQGAVCLLAALAIGRLVVVQLIDFRRGPVGAAAEVVEVGEVRDSPYAVFRRRGNESQALLYLYLTRRAAEKLAAGDEVSITYYPASRRVASIRWK